MASLVVEWTDATGMEPPPPYTPDSYRIFVRYRGSWKRSLDTEVLAGVGIYQFSNQPGGEYTVRVYGVYGGTLVSLAYAVDSIILEGDTVDAEFGDAPPSGSEDVPAPSAVTLTSP